MSTKSNVRHVLKPHPTDDADNDGDLRAKRGSSEEEFGVNLRIRFMEVCHFKVLSHCLLAEPTKCLAKYAPKLPEHMKSEPSRYEE